VLAGTAAVLAAAASVALLHGEVSNRADDRAWALALAHDQLGWNVAATVVSNLTPSLGGGAALLLLGAVLSVRSRRWTPVLVCIGAVAVLGAVVAAGKLLLHQGGVAGHRGYRIPGPRWPSGPATTAVVVSGVATLLLRGRARWARALVVFAAVVVVLNGVEEVFLGQHRLCDVLASWTTGLAIVTAVALAAGPHLSGLPDGPFLPTLVDLLAGTVLERPMRRAHMWLLVRGRGRLGSRWPDGSRVLALEVLDRRTGRAGRVPVAVVEHPDGLVATTVNGRPDRRPTWPEDLRAAGAAVVHRRGGPQRVVPDEGQREKLWAHLVACCPAAADRARAGDPLPVVLLRPVRTEDAQ